MADGDTGLAQNGVLQVIPPAVLEAQIRARDKAAAEARAPQSQPVPQLVGFIKGQYEIFRNHRNTVSGWSNRMIEALRVFNGQYNPSKMQEVMKFGGSQVYARLSAQKCRAASSLLRDVYLSNDVRPWSIRASLDPPVPPEILQKITQLVQQEASQVWQTLGQPPQTEDLLERRRALLESAQDAAKKKARALARASEDKIEEILREGDFYEAFAQFLVDLPIFPFACLKGPVVRIVPEVIWPPGGGRPMVRPVPKLTWQRIAPFDLWWTPGVASIENAAIIEKSQVTRAELNECLDLPGFNVAEVRAVLEEYGRGGLYDNWDVTDAERAVLESRENPAWNRSQMISQMEFNGNVQGRVLQEHGMEGITDELRDYHVQAWCIGSHVIKSVLSPSPRQRHPYFITSYEKVPGTPIGNGLIDLINDLQEVANATLRSLVNNVSIASGPQVVINDDRILPSENPDELFPWKRWHARNDPIGSNTKAPMEFYQPQDNSQSLIQTFKAFVELADDVSAIPKYVGGQATGGAGRTSSGLAMLMGNASKILQTVAANVDRDIFQPALEQLVDLVLLTDTSGILTGEEKVTVEGVSIAVQRETLRQRQLEFLQHTGNPIDMQIIGIDGRGKVLRSVSNTVGFDGDDIVPSDRELEQKQQASQQQGPQQALDQRIEKGVQEGIEAGIKRITTELAAGQLAQRMAMPEGMPTHLGTLPGTAGGQPMAEAAAQAQGSQPTPGNQSAGPQTNLTGSQPAPPGPGERPPPPAAGP